MHDELFHETLRPIEGPTFAYNFVGICRDSQGQPLAILGQVPPSSLIAWHSNGRGTWARDLEIISLPHLFCHWRHDHTVAAILQRRLRMHIVSRREHPRRTGQGHVQRQLQVWEPGQAQASSSSAPKGIAQPMASQGKAQPMASQGKLILWRVRGQGAEQKQRRLQTKLRRRRHHLRGHLHLHHHLHRGHLRRSRRVRRPARSPRRRIAGGGAPGHNPQSP